MPGKGSIAFRSNPAVTKKLPAEFAEMLGAKQVFMAGEMIQNQEQHVFILIEYNGNPTVIYFRERDGTPMGDSESFSLMLAPAKQEQNDLILIGGDFNNQAFQAFQRTGR